MGLKVNRILNQFIEILLTLISLLIFVSLLFPLFLLIIIPSYFWRLSTRLFVKLFRKDILRIMDGKNPVLAVDDIHSRPLCTIVGMGAFDLLDVESAKKYVTAVVNATNPKNPEEWLHPELHQYYVEKFGFFWWKKEKNFAIEDHVEIWNGEGKAISEDDFIQIISFLEKEPFKKKTSPWSAMLVGNCQFASCSPHPKTAVVFRFHHGLADGIAMLSVFMEYVFEDTFEKVAKPVFIERNIWQKRFHRMYSLLQLPYQFFRQGFDSFDVNDWHLPEEKLSRKIHKAWSSRIPTETIKEIKKIHKVGFTSVLIAAIAGAIRNAMENHKVKLPKKMHAILPLPWKKHPPKFCNHWSYGFLEVPVGKEDAKKRLLKSHKQVEELKKGTNPYVNFYLLSIVNLLPTWLIKKLTLTNYLPTLILSNFPGPPSESKGIGGYALADCCFTGGPLRGNIGISITILSYHGGLRIITGVDDSLAGPELAQELIYLLDKEFANLLKSADRV